MLFNSSDHQREYMTMLLKMIQYWYSRSHAYLYHLQNDICKNFAQRRQLIVEL